MKKDIHAFLIPIFLVSAIAISTFINVFRVLISEIDAISRTTIIVPKRTECLEFNQFMTMIQSVDPKLYRNPGNNCYDQSKALQKNFAELGIYSTIMIQKEPSHAWLGIWLDATTGRFVDPESAYNVFEMRDENLNVICSK